MVRPFWHGVCATWTNFRLFSTCDRFLWQTCGNIASADSLSNHLMERVYTALQSCHGGTHVILSSVLKMKQCQMSHGALKTIVNKTGSGISVIRRWKPCYQHNQLSPGWHATRREFWLPEIKHPDCMSRAAWFQWMMEPFTLSLTEVNSIIVNRVDRAGIWGNGDLQWSSQARWRLRGASGATYSAVVCKELL